MRPSRHRSRNKGLAVEVANTKKAFTTEELVMNFMEFTKRSDEVSAALAWETQRLVRMHYAQIVIAQVSSGRLANCAAQTRKHKVCQNVHKKTNDEVC